MLLPTQLTRPTILVAALCLPALLPAEEIFPLPAFPVEGTALAESRVFERAVDYQLPVEADDFTPFGSRLERLPGVDLARRGPHALQPVLRGHSGDRVSIQLNGLPLPEATPTQTASPVNLFDLPGMFRAGVERGISSVTAGPVGTGGRISLDTVFPEDEKTGFRIQLDSVSDGISLGARHAGSLDRFRVNSGFLFADHGDYKAGGDGREVDADYRGWSAGAAVSARLGQRQTLSLSSLYVRQDLVRNPSLPLDTLDTDSIILTLGHACETRKGVLQFRMGYFESEPFLSSVERVVADSSPVARVEARAEARSAGAGLRYVMEGGGDLVVEAGLDVSWQNRDTIRTRYLKSGARFNDRIWPDVRQWQPGAFLEFRSRSEAGPSWEAGVRVDRTMSEAGAAGDPVVGLPAAQGATIRDNYIAFNGSEAGRTSRNSWTGSLDGVVEFPLRELATLSVAGAFTVAPPGVGQRYRAFLNALGGGFELGNPNLDSEVKAEVSARLSADYGPLSLLAEVFYADIRDYIQRAVVQDAPLVYSFRNSDARFKGLELASVLRLVDTEEQSLGIPVRFSLVDGESRDTGRDLPEIPPWETSVGLDYRAGTPLGIVRAELLARHVTSRENPDPGLDPVFRDTGSFNLLDASVSLALPRGFRIGLFIGNLTDTEAYPYLQPPVEAGFIGPSSGDLQGGEAIPLPGRNLRLVLSAAF